MPLERLKLHEDSHFTDDGMKHLQGLPILYFELHCSSNITDAGLRYIKGMPLLHLSIYDVKELTDARLLDLLEGTALQYLLLSRTPKITEQGLVQLGDLPLRRLIFVQENCNCNVQVPWHVFKDAAKRDHLPTERF